MIKYNVCDQATAKQASEESEEESALKRQIEAHKQGMLKTDERKDDAIRE